MHWPFTDQNTAELSPPYQKTWEGMEEVQREVRHLLLASRIRCARRRLSVPAGLARDRQHRCGHKEVEEFCLGRAPTPQLGCRCKPERNWQLATAYEMGLPGVQEPDHVVPQVQCLMNSCSGKNKGELASGGSF